MVELTRLQQGVLEIVTLRGSGNPITGKDIANAVGLKPRSSGKDGADLRSIIHALRVKGYPVCASGSGYFWPKDGDELKAYIGSLEARANEQQEAADGLKLGYSVVGVAKGAQAVKDVTKVKFSALKGGVRTVFSVSEAQILEFLREYPEAERI